jgi:hypothetical protein
VKVVGRWSVKTVDVRATSTGLCSRTGSALLALVADRVSLTGGLREALAATRERRSAPVPGRVFCDLAVMLADRGWCVSDLAALAGQESLFGNVASVSTAHGAAGGAVGWRVGAGWYPRGEGGFSRSRMDGGRGA